MYCIVFYMCRWLVQDYTIDKGQSQGYRNSLFGSLFMIGYCEPSSSPDIITKKKKKIWSSMNLGNDRELKLIYFLLEFSESWMYYVLGEYIRHNLSSGIFPKIIWPEIHCFTTSLRTCFLWNKQNIILKKGNFCHNTYSYFLNSICWENLNSNILWLTAWQ